MLCRYRVNVFCDTFKHRSLMLDGTGEPSNPYLTVDWRLGWELLAFLIFPLDVRFGEVPKNDRVLSDVVTGFEFSCEG